MRAHYEPEKILHYVVIMEVYWIFSTFSCPTAMRRALPRHFSTPISSSCVSLSLGAKWPHDGPHSFRFSRAPHDI